jgi:hypothetical protein
MMIAQATGPASASGRAPRPVVTCPAWRGNRARICQRGSTPAASDRVRAEVRPRRTRTSPPSPPGKPASGLPLLARPGRRSSPATGEARQPWCRGFVRPALTSLARAWLERHDRIKRHVDHHADARSPYDGVAPERSDRRVSSRAALRAHTAAAAAAWRSVTACAAPRRRRRSSTDYSSPAAGAGSTSGYA